MWRQQRPLTERVVLPHRLPVVAAVAMHLHPFLGRTFIRRGTEAPLGPSWLRQIGLRTTYPYLFARCEYDTRSVRSSGTSLSGKPPIKSHRERRGQWSTTCHEDYKWTRLNQWPDQTLFSGRYKHVLVEQGRRERLLRTSPEEIHHNKLSLRFCRRVQHLLYFQRKRKNLIFNGPGEQNRSSSSLSNISRALSTVLTVELSRYSSVSSISICSCISG